MQLVVPRITCEPMTIMTWPPTQAATFVELIDILPVMTSTDDGPLIVPPSILDTDLYKV